MRGHLPLIVMIAVWVLCTVIGVVISYASRQPLWLCVLPAFGLGFLWGVAVALHVDYIMCRPQKPDDLKRTVIGAYASVTILTLLLLVLLLPFPVNYVAFLITAFIGSVVMETIANAP